MLFQKAIQLLWVYLQKSVKPVLECLKQEDQLSAILVDDSYLPIETYLEYQKSVNATVDLLCKLDFVIHSNRSILKPTRKMDFLVLS